jgi:hypothetical protein
MAATVEIVHSQRPTLWQPVLIAGSICGRAAANYQRVTGTGGRCEGGFLRAVEEPPAAS